MDFMVEKIGDTYRLSERKTNRVVMDQVPFDEIAKHLDQHCANGEGTVRFNFPDVPEEYKRRIVPTDTRMVAVEESETQEGKYRVRDLNSLNIIADGISRDDLKRELLAMQEADGVELRVLAHKNCCPAS